MKCDQWLIRWQLASSRPADDYSRSARASDPALGFRGAPPGPERDGYRASCLISRLSRCKDLPPARHTISHPVIFITQGWWSFLEDPRFYTFPSTPASPRHCWGSGDGTSRTVPCVTGWGRIAGGERSVCLYSVCERDLLMENEGTALVILDTLKKKKVLKRLKQKYVIESKYLKDFFLDHYSLSKYYLLITNVKKNAFFKSKVMWNSITKSF